MEKSHQPQFVDLAKQIESLYNEYLDSANKGAVAGDKNICSSIQITVNYLQEKVHKEYIEALRKMKDFFETCDCYNGDLGAFQKDFDLVQADAKEINDILANVDLKSCMKKDELC